jgi:FKBP-type peptidyl-prolyl cis-trans isomerase 2
MQQVQQDSVVTLHYAIRLNDGSLVEDTFGDEPITVELGRGKLVSGLERALIGQSVGKRCQFVIASEAGYGPHDPEGIKEISLTEFPEELNPLAGQIISFQFPLGEEVAGTVLAVSGESVTVDFNHPLAGHELHITAEILSVS